MLRIVKFMDHSWCSCFGMLAVNILFEIEILKELKNVLYNQLIVQRKLFFNYASGCRDFESSLSSLQSLFGFFASIYGLRKGG